MRIHPARRRGARHRDGDIVRLFNDRGACLAGAVLSDGCAPASCSCRPAPGTIPRSGRAEAPLCVHGNPNVLTRDVGTSRLAQGCTGQIARVEIERFDGRCRRSRHSIRRGIDPHRSR